MGLHYGKVAKDVYIDGHEQTDVVECQEKVSISRRKDLQRRMVDFSKDGFWERPLGRNAPSPVISC